MIERREAIRRRVVVVVSVNEGKTLAQGDVTRYRYGGRQAVLIPLQSKVPVLNRKGAARGLGVSQNARSTRLLMEQIDSDPACWGERSRAGSNMLTGVGTEGSRREGMGVRVRASRAS